MKSLSLAICLMAASSTGCAGLLAIFQPPKPAEPLATAEVEAVTTCKGSNIAKIKKNLMLAGYSIRNESADTLETEFKQVDGAGTQASSERIMVVKVDDQNIRFRVRVKSEGMAKVETGRVTTTSGRTVATDSQLVHTQNETDEKYFKDTLPLHQKTQKDVCGA